MNAVTPKGWCPSLFDPMPAADGLLVRVKPPGGVLTAAAARQLATAAAEFGNGTIELTSRANLQVRGLRPEGTAPFAAAMVAAGLADADPARERRRAVIFPLQADLDRAPLTIAVALEALLADLPLPPKFVVAVDGGGTLPLGSVGADIVVICTGWSCVIVPNGSPDAAVTTAAEAPAAVRRLACAFLELTEQLRIGTEISEPIASGSARLCHDRAWPGHPRLCCSQQEQTWVAGPSPAMTRIETAQPVAAHISPRPLSPLPRRMRGLVSAVGAARLFAAAGLAATPAPASRPTPAAIGWLPIAAGEPDAFGCGLPFGTTTAATFARLADLAEQFGDGALRPTPWRAILLTGIAPTNVPALATALARLGLIVEPDDPRRMIVTCPGRPGCASATVDVRADATALLGLGPVHVSGCAKGCAHPAPASFTLVGEDGHYNLVRNGRAGDTPSARHLTIAQAAALLQESA